ncbi:DUF3472 domain-containing protein [Prescottella defluvii]|uniref:hypothetical protein n=1 Tax=Prescottella defluvii TaxID=1323361 RepID=UPI0004F2E25B|nr:hypothetical protein [Prescottella defluvii]
MGWIGSRTARSLAVAFGVAAAVAVATPATASATVVPGELVQIDWLATNGGTKGISEFAFPLTIDEIGVTGPGQPLSVGQHFRYQNWQTGYIGLEIERPTADGPLVARTVLSYFGPDVQQAGCGPIFPGTGGMTCRGEIFDFALGRTYTMRVEQTGSNYWHAYAEDGTVQRSIGGVSIKNELRRMMPFGHQSVGYYGPAGSCAEVPYARVRLGTPMAYSTPVDHTGAPVLVAPRRPNLTCFGGIVNDAVAVPGGVAVTVGRG